MQLNERRPIGGHLCHLVPAGQRKALCGFEPGAKRTTGRQMDYRHGWAADRAWFGRCKRCEAIVREVAAANIITPGG